MNREWPVKLHAPGTSSELAWAAGFFDGEGCIRVNSSKRQAHKKMYHSLVVSVTQYERSTLERMQRAVGGKIHGPYAGHNGRIRFQLDAYGATARQMMSFLVPYLSEPKLEQYDRARDRLSIRREMEYVR